MKGENEGDCYGLYTSNFYTWKPLTETDTSSTTPEALLVIRMPFMRDYASQTFTKYCKNPSKDILWQKKKELAMFSCVFSQNSGLLPPQRVERILFEIFNVLKSERSFFC